MGVMGWDCSDRPLRLVKVIAVAVYVESHWRLGKLGNNSQVSQ